MSLPNATGSDDNLTGNRYDRGNSDYSRYENGLGWQGNRQEYTNVMGEYSERAYQGIQNGRYPSGMEDVIKQYFSSF